MDKQRKIRGWLGIIGGAALGYVFAMDVSGWYFHNPITLLLMEIIGAIVLYRVTISLMEDERISAPAKRGYFWGLIGLISAHVMNLGYIYFKDLQASFFIDSIDFAETLAMSWAYMHFTMIGFILGAVVEYIFIASNKYNIDEMEIIEDAQLASGDDRKTQ